MSEEQEAIIKSGKVSFPAEEPLIRSLVLVAEHYKVDHETLARSFVAERLRVPVDIIDKIKRDEDSAYNEVRAYLGGSVSLIEGVLKLYDVLFDSMGKTKLSLDAHQVSALLPCLQACRYQMIMANLSGLRAHPFDQANFRRKEIEFCAFAIKILQSAEHAKIWMNAISNTAYDKYEKAFSISATVAEAAAIMGDRLKKAYNELSKQVHASPFAIATQIRIEDRVHKLEFFQHQTDQKRTFLAMTVLSGIENDYLVVKALGTAIKQKSKSFDEKTWNRDLQEFEKSLNKVKTDWAPTLDPTGVYRKGQRPPRKAKKK